MKLGCHTCRFFQRDVEQKSSAKKCTRAHALMGDYWCDVWGCVACFNPELRECKNYEPRVKNACTSSSSEINVRKDQTIL